jgi:hypothetical protein
VLSIVDGPADDQWSACRDRLWCDLGALELSIDVELERVPRRDVEVQRFSVGALPDRLRAPALENAQRSSAPEYCRKKPLSAPESWLTAVPKTLDFLESR